MAEAIVSSVIERVGGLVVSEGKFLYGLQVNNAQIKLQCMSAFLKDADAWSRDGRNERVSLLVEFMRENSLDLEDVIETYLFQGANNSIESIGVFRYAMKLPFLLLDVHIVGSEIERISSNIATWTSELEALGVQRLIYDKAANEACSSSYYTQKELRKVSSHVVDNHVVGLKDYIEELVALLIKKENTHKHKVISVHGMGGLGKTTLARKVYQHPDVRKHFDFYAWASISQQCNKREVLETILFGFTSPNKERREEIKMKSDVELAKELHDFQIKWKCLVVLDDIWTTTTWDLLKDAFPTTQGDTLHSKILLTTRKRNVALHVDQHGFLHKPQFLDDKESLELFQKKYFPTRTDLPSNSNDDDERKTDLAKVMLEKCGGLPLAIIVLAGLLSKIHTIYEWELMKTSVLKCMDQDEQHDDDSEYRSVLWVLGLSYTELPPQLKPCFLYLARYPEDATIRVRELCLVLMAEGFISPKRNSAKTTEEVAYDWLCELVERSMIQVKEMSSIGRIKSFCIHDLMRHVCITKAQDEMFLHFIDLRNKEVEENIETTKARRVSIYDDNVVDRNARFPGMVQNMNDSLRYFSVKGPSMEFGEGVFGHVCNHFLMLRVLIIDDMNGTLELPEEIGNLIHLRLFSVPFRKIKEIPSCFGNFRCLQTLRVLASNSILPESMWKLEQLRHLYFSLASNVPIGKFLRSTKSRNIQTLVGICAKDLVQSDFQYLNNLKKLKIYVDPSSVPLFNTPQTLTFTCLLSLQVNNYFDTIDVVPLILSCPRIYKLTLNSGIERLPEVNQFSRNLMKLKLSKLNLENDPMPTLEKLPELRVLVISNHSFVGNEMVCSRGGFHRLESLEFIGLIDLREWKVEENALPRLGYLRIRECRGLRSVPDGLRNIVTLKEMVIQFMPKNFKERMEEGGDDFDKVKHVPSRVFFECDTD